MNGVWVVAGALLMYFLISLLEHQNCKILIVILESLSGLQKVWYEQHGRHF